MKVSELFEAKERSVLSMFGHQLGVYKDKGFDCRNSQLTSLVGSPKSVALSFICSDNRLKSLDGIASSIGGDLLAHYNKLESLHNIHKQIKHIGGKAYFQDNNIKSHVLGLLLIDGLQRVKLCDVFMKGRLHRVEAIINKHLENGRDVFACQEELIDSKLEAFAQL